MNELLLASIVFALAVIINSGSVYLQKRRSIYGRFGKQAQLVHALVILPAWLWFLYELATLNQYNGHEHIVTTSIGGFVVVFAIGLFAAAIDKIGSQALVNGDLFKPARRVTSGVYRYLKSPIYVSYTLGLLGVGILLQNTAYLWLAVLSIPLLHGLEDWAENSH